MQTEAEKYLIKILKEILQASLEVLRIINLGAGKSSVVEDDLLTLNKKFICDRVDVDKPELDADFVEHIYIHPLEDMASIPDNNYDLAFANFVLEHISNSKQASIEMARILKPGASLVLSLSNPLAPEFRLAKHTPISFHQLFRKKGHDEAFPVKYVYKNIKTFIKQMESAGWKLKEEKYFPATYSYLHRFFLLKGLSKIYDHLLIKLKAKSWMGHCVLHFTIDKSK